MALMRGKLFAGALFAGALLAGGGEQPVALTERDFKNQIVVLNFAGAQRPIFIRGV